MCGVVGYSGIPTEATAYSFKALMVESTIRGAHAYGIAWLTPSGQLKVFKSLSFVEVMNAIPKPFPNKIIFHNRYSTSGDHRRMANNQPIHVKDSALVFNGTVDMGTKAEMEQRTGISLTTENDGELVLNDIWGSEPFKRLKDEKATFAGIYLERGGRMFAFRNELRPLWAFPVNGGKFITSTKDIGSRAKIRVSEGTSVRPYTLLEL